MAYNDEQIALLRQLLQSRAWTDAMKPALIERGRIMTKLALSLQSARPKPYNEADDSFMKGIVHDIEWMVTSFEQEIAVYDYNRRKDNELVQAYGSRGEPVTQ